MFIFLLDRKNIFDTLLILDVGFFRGKGLAKVKQRVLFIWNVFSQGEETAF